MLSPPSQILLGHDPSSPLCDLVVGRLVRRIAAAARVMPSIEEVGSLEAGWEALDRASHAQLPPLVLACLDLVPAPRAGLSFAGWAAALALPVILISHGTRWVERDSAASELVQLSPLASDEEVGQALSRALVPRAAYVPPDDAFPARPSWLG